MGTKVKEDTDEMGRGPKGDARSAWQRSCLVTWLLSLFHAKKLRSQPMACA